MQSSPFPRYLVPRRCKYSPQHHVLKHPQRPFLPRCQRPSLHPYKTTDKIIVLYILIFKFLDSNLEDKLIVVFMYFIVMYVLFYIFCFLFCFSVYCFMCKCVLYYCHRVSTQLQLTNIYLTSYSTYGTFPFCSELTYKKKISRITVCTRLSTCV